MLAQEAPDRAPTAPLRQGQTLPGPGGACDLLLYTHSFDGGGAERVMVQLANHWAEAGARVALVVNVATGPLAQDLAREVAVRALDQPRGLLAAPALARTIRRLAPRAVISAMTEQNVTACIARRLARFRGRLLTVEHNFMSNALASTPLWRRQLLTRAMRLTYPMADCVSAVSEASARDLEELIDLPSASVAVLYNPIWPMSLTAGAAPPTVHPWLGGPDPVLLTVGRLVAQKNHANLLAALAIARGSRPLRLIILGEGPLRAGLEAEARTLGLEGVVDFLGFRRNVADFLHFADLFVLSSDREGLPLSLMEAMKMGTPVVATDCQSGPRELLENGRYGRLVPIQDPAALAAAILDTLADPPPAAALTARAGDFATDAIARRYEAALFPGEAIPWRLA